MERGQKCRKSRNLKIINRLCNIFSLFMTKSGGMKWKTHIHKKNSFDKPRTKNNKPSVCEDNSYFERCSASLKNQ